MPRPAIGCLMDQPSDDASSGATPRDDQVDPTVVLRSPVAVMLSVEKLSSGQRMGEIVQFTVADALALGEPGKAWHAYTGRERFDLACQAAVACAQRRGLKTIKAHYVMASDEWNQAPVLSARFALARAARQGLAQAAAAVPTVPGRP